MSSKRFRQSGHTMVVTLLDLPFIWLGTYAIVNGLWIVAIVCIIASIGLGVLQINALAADYAKWRQSEEVNDGNS